MADSAHVLIPLKRLDSVKTRLGELLPLVVRQALMLAMLEDVVAAAQQVESVTEITLVSSDPWAPGIALENGIGCWYDRHLPWNAALATCASEIVRVPRVLFLSADIPLVRGEDVEVLLISTPENGCTIARAHDGGTNAIAMSPPGAFATRFGTYKSAAVHLALAEQHGLSVSVIDRPGLAFDLDTPAEAAQLLDADYACQARRILELALHGAGD